VCVWGGGAVQLNVLDGKRVPNLDISFLVVMILSDKDGRRWNVTCLMTMFVFQGT
jgi:hypothetical protein